MLKHGGVQGVCESAGQYGVSEKSVQYAELGVEVVVVPPLEEIISRTLQGAPSVMRIMWWTSWLSFVRYSYWSYWRPFTAKLLRLCAKDCVENLKVLGLGCAVA